MPRTLLGASSTSLPSLLTGGGGVTPKLQLRHTHTSAQPDQPVVDVPPRHAPLSLPEAADATSAWSMSQQAASQQRRRERQQQQLQMHHHQQDRTSQPAPVVGDDADDGHLPLDEDDDEDLQPFKPPTQVDSPEPIRGDTMKRTPIATHQQVQQAHSQQMQSHATHTAPSSSFVSSSAASLMRGPSFGTNRPPSQPLGGALSYTSTYSTSGSQHMSESLTTSASQSQSQFYSQSRTSDSLSQSLSFSQSLSLSQSRSSPILPPLTSSMASSSTMTDGRSGTSIGVHSSDPGASMVAFHPPPPKLPQLPSRLIAEASSRVQQAEAKKRKNAAQKSGANLLQVKSTSTATTFDALMQQQQQHPGDTQSRIPFVQQKSSIPHSMRAQLPPTHSQQASALHPGAFGSGHRDATASSARPDSSSSFAASPLQHPTTVMGLNTAPPPATAAPMSSHPALAPRTGQPAGRTRLMAEAREKRFESYSLHYPRLQSVTSRDDLERLQLSCDVLKIILQSNGVAIGNKRKEECFDNVWTIIRSKGLKPPTREKTRRPRLDAIAAFATQAAETYEEEEHDDRMDDSRIAYSQPIEGEPAVKRVRANQTPLAHLPPHSSQRTFDFRQPMDTAASTSAATAATALGLSHTPPFSTMAHGPSSARALFDLHARSGSSLSPPPPWVAAPPVFLPAPRYFRMTQPTSTFPLGVGAELVVIVQEYLQFQAVHRFSIDALASFTSARFSLVSGTTQSLLEIARGTGLVRAKLMSFVPVLQSDYLSERRKTRSEWNACYAGDPPSPWCVLTCRVEPEAGHAATSTPTLFTLYYHDAHWRSTGSRVTHTGWRVDGVTGLRHLATQNAAHFLVEAEMFDATWQQTWSIKQIVCMKMMHQRIARDDEATSAAAAAATSMDNTLHPHLTREVVNRIGCIIDIRVQAVEPSQTEYFSRSPYRCLHVMWMKHADATDEEDAAGAYATDLTNQDVSCVSPWELDLPQSDVVPYAWMPSVKLDSKETNPLQLSISHALLDMLEVVWSPMQLRGGGHGSGGSNDFYTHMLPTPMRRLVHIRAEFDKVCANHAARIFTHWSLFAAAIGRIVSLLLSAMMLHCDLSELVSSDDVPTVVPTGMEQLPPIPDAHVQAIATSLAALHQRMEEDQRQMHMWRSECPRAVHKVCASAAAFMQQRLRVASTWEDDFGHLHIASPPGGRERMPDCARRATAAGRTYEQAADIMRDETSM